MGSNALKATILDRGHAKEASRGVESHFAAQGTIRQRIRQPVTQRIRQPVTQLIRQPGRQPVVQRPGPPVWPDSAFLPPLEPL